MNDIYAVLLVGGKGTRLGELYPDRPKALVPVAGRPFLEWQLAWLARQGIRHAHLAAGHQAHRLRTWLEFARLPPLSVTLSVEPEPRGTAGGLKHAAPFLDAESLLVLNGDSYQPNLALSDLAATRTRSRARVTIAVTQVSDAGRYGTVVTDPPGPIRGFAEKGAAGPGWINGGVYLMDRSLLDDIPAGRFVSLEHDCFPGWCEQNLIHAFPFDPPLLDMGTPAGLAELERFLRQGEP